MSTVENWARHLDASREDVPFLRGLTLSMELMSCQVEVFSEAVQTDLAESRASETLQKFARSVLTLLDSQQNQLEQGQQQHVHLIRSGFAGLSYLCSAAIRGADVQGTKAKVWPIVATFVDRVAFSIAAEAPATADFLADMASQMRAELGLGECACAVCAALAAIEAEEQRWDALDGPTMSELVDVTSRYRDAVGWLVRIMPRQTAQPVAPLVGESD